MAAEREQQTHVVPLPGLSAASKKASNVWSRGNSILAFGGIPRDAEVEDNETPAPFYQVQWETSLYHPITRKLVCESAGLFHKLQTSMKEAADDDNADLIHASRMYRSVIKACIHDLKIALESEADVNLKADYEEQGQMFHKMELIWNLCEVIMIDFRPGGAFLRQLVDWIKWNCDKFDKIAEDVVRADNQENHPGFWPAVYGYILQGRNYEACKLLQYHSSRKTDAFISVDELLRKMPTYLMFAGQSLSEFNMRWRLWQEECLHRLKEGEYAANKNVEKICRILIGENEVFEEFVPLCETWYHMLVSRLLYTNPTVTGCDLAQMGEIADCIDMYGGSNQMTSLDIILQSIFEFEYFQLIKESSNLFDGWWFVGHLTDLLMHTKQMSCQQTSFEQLREKLLLDYAACLMTHHSLWQIGVTYLQNCPVYGRQHLEAYLELIPLDTEWKAQKVISIAKDNNLQELVWGVCKVVSMRALQNGSLGSALTWALRSKDATLANFLADKFLSEYRDKGQFSSLDLLDNLGSCMTCSDRLIFLGKYREFHKVYEEGDFKMAASELVFLLTSGLAPKYFWMTLLWDALPLLEKEEPVFSSEQTYELLYCMEELEKYNSSTAGKIEEDPNSKLQKELAKEKDDLIRLALARNLARTFLVEQSVD